MDSTISYNPLPSEPDPSPMGKASPVPVNQNGALEAMSPAPQNIGNVFELWNLFQRWLTALTRPDINRYLGNSISFSHLISDTCNLIHALESVGLRDNSLLNNRIKLAIVALRTCLYLVRWLYNRNEQPTPGADGYYNHDARLRNDKWWFFINLLGFLAILITYILSPHVADIVTPAVADLTSILSGIDATNNIVGFAWDAFKDTKRDQQIVLNAKIELEKAELKLKLAKARRQFKQADNKSAETKSNPNSTSSPDSHLKEALYQLEALHRADALRQLIESRLGRVVCNLSSLHSLSVGNLPDELKGMLADIARNQGLTVGNLEDELEWLRRQLEEVCGQLVEAEDDSKELSEIKFKLRLAKARLQMAQDEGNPTELKRAQDDLIANQGRRLRSGHSGANQKEIKILNCDVLVPSDEPHLLENENDFKDQPKIKKKVPPSKISSTSPSTLHQHFPSSSPVSNTPTAEFTELDEDDEEKREDVEEFVDQKLNTDSKDPNKNQQDTRDNKSPNDSQDVPQDTLIPGPPTIPLYQHFSLSSPVSNIPTVAVGESTTSDAEFQPLEHEVAVRKANLAWRERRRNVTLVCESLMTVGKGGLGSVATVGAAKIIGSLIVCAAVGNVWGIAAWAIGFAALILVPRFINWVYSNFIAANPPTAPSLPQPASEASSLQPTMPPIQPSTLPVESGAAEKSDREDKVLTLPDSAQNTQISSGTAGGSISSTSLNSTTSTHSINPDTSSSNPSPIKSPDTDKTFHRPRCYSTSSTSNGQLQRQRLFVRPNVCGREDSEDVLTIPRSSSCLV